MRMGYIKVWRKMIDNPAVWDDPEALKVWMWILLNVVWDSGRATFHGKTIDLMPGQRTVGRKIIAAECKVHESKVKRILERFKSDQLINTETDHRCTLLTVVSWDRYQKNDQPLTQPTTNERPTNDQPVTTNKERKKERKDNGDTTARSDKPKRATSMVDEELLLSLESNPAYRGINVRREYGKMLAWLDTPRGKGKHPSKQRFVNWLNRANPEDTAKPEKRGVVI